MGREAVGHRDRVVPLSPDDQGGQLAEQIEAVDRAHVLASDVDHGAQGLDERAPGRRFLERLHGACHGLHVDALADAACPHPLADAIEGRADAPVGDHPDPGRGTGQRGATEHRAHLMAEAAARDQRKPLDSLGELVEELHRDPAAERVTDDGGAVDADGRQQVADAAGVGAEGVVAADGCGVAVAEQVGSDHGVAVGQPQRHLLPVLRGVDHAVDQYDRRAVTGDPVDHPVAVQLDLPFVEEEG